MTFPDHVACFSCGDRNIILAVNKQTMLPVDFCRSCGFYCTSVTNAEHRRALAEERAEQPTEIPYDA